MAKQQVCKITQAVQKLNEADSLMREALKLLPRNHRFGSAVCDAQVHLGDAIVLADPKQTLIE